MRSAPGACPLRGTPACAQLQSLRSAALAEQHVVEGAAAEERVAGASVPELVRRALLATSALAVVVYLGWRLLFTLHPDHLALSVLLYVADAVGGLGMLGFCVSVWRLHRPAAAPPPPDDLSVDVWIPTYNEDLDLLRRTIYHAVRMDHPHETYVLDDGRRPEVAALAESLGARYLTRPDTGPVVDHGASAKRNAKHALSNLVAILPDKTVQMLLKAFAYDKDAFDAGLDDALPGLQPTVRSLPLALYPLLDVAGVALMPLSLAKNAIDAAVHGIASLFQGPNP